MRLGTPLCHFVTSPPAERGERGQAPQSGGEFFGGFLALLGDEFEDWTVEDEDVEFAIVVWGE